jgi:predicted RNA-binding protein YlqC (UPF0109 family)
MKAFLEYVLKNLVDAPDEVSVGQVTREGRSVYEVRVRPGDVGKVVGKQGQTIAAIRNLMGAAASRYGTRVEVDIIEDGPPRRNGGAGLDSGDAGNSVTEAGEGGTGTQAGV